MKTTKKTLDKADWGSVGYATCLLRQGRGRIAALKEADALFGTSLAVIFAEPKGATGAITAAVSSEHPLAKAIDRLLGKA
ncbi:MAG: hypothetical protein IT158_24090 [Bryobacterales bacterium]|nr:hypothetical protein [Bryobacterales bacterium]